MKFMLSKLHENVKLTNNHFAVDRGLEFSGRGDRLLGVGTSRSNREGSECLREEDILRVVGIAG